MLEIIPSVLPILLLIGFGFFMHKKEIIGKSTADGLKKLAIDIGLPALLFISFMDMELKIEYLSLTIILFLFFCALFLIGIGLVKIKGLSIPSLPYLIPGFAVATLGIPLYLSLFGLENLSQYTILSVGHEIFFWFVLIAMLQMKQSGKGFSLQMVMDVIKNPFIIAVILGLILNITGLNIVLGENFIYKGIENFLEYLGNLVTPLILIVIGYDLKLDKRYIKDSFRILVIRIPLILILGYMVKILLLDRILTPDPYFDYAWFTYLILPPPFAMSLFIGRYSTEDNRNIATNTTVLATIISIIIYIIFALVIST
jgi:hypothetical protein